MKIFEITYFGIDILILILSTLVVHINLSTKKEINAATLIFWCLFQIIATTTLLGYLGWLNKYNISISSLIVMLAGCYCFGCTSTWRKITNLFGNWELRFKEFPKSLTKYESWLLYSLIAMLVIDFIFIIGSS